MTHTFNPLKDKWFIRVNTFEECVAVQEWAFSKGLTWAGSGLVRKDFNTWCSLDDGTRAIGRGHSGSSLGQASSSFWESRGHKEIFVKVKTVIDSVVYPEVESAQQKKIRELEETITKAHEQIQALKKED